MNSPSDWRRDRVFWLLFGASALLGLIYNAVILIGYAPDETRHMAYIRLLVEERTLPRLLADGSEYQGAHTLHPPLYYGLLAPLYALFGGLPGDAVWHIARAGSLALCLAALPLIYEVAGRAPAEADEATRRAVARLATAHVALLPIFGMTSGSINNDGGTLFFVALWLWLATVKYFHRRDFTAAVVLGVAMAAGGYCKLNALLAIGAAMAAYFVAQDGIKVFWSPRVWARAAIIIGIALLLLSPWLWHNAQVFGTPIPVPPRMATPTGGQWMMVFHPDFPAAFAQANWSLLGTMWSQKDWIPAVVRPAIWCGLAVYVALGLIGWLLDRRRRTTAGDTPSRIARRGSILAFAFNWLAVLQGALFLTWGWAEGGRYLLPSLFGAAIVLALGWRALLGARFKVFLGAWCAAMIALNALCVYWLLAYLNPTFGPK